MQRIWRCVDRSHRLDERTHAELVWMAFQSRHGVRWAVVTSDLPVVFLLATYRSAVPLWLIGLVVVTSCVRVALAETYHRFGDRSQARSVQRRWETAYLVVGTSHAATLALTVGVAVETGNGWLVAWLLATVMGFSYGIIGYVANRPMIAYAMTFAAVAGTVVSLVGSGHVEAYWLAGAMSLAYLAIRSLIERHYAAAVRAIGDRHAVERYAETDHLTGLSNRRHLESVVLAILRERVTGVSWLGIDLDGFKRVNDTFGHTAGDIVLKVVAARISALAGPTSVVARVGGDEFVILLIADRPRSKSVADAISSSLAEPIRLPQGTARIGASVGATMICPTDTIEGIAKRADERMYAEKGAMRTAA